MYEKLHQYLLVHKQLPLPGIGTFLVERKPAEADFANKIINAPIYSVTLRNETGSLPKKFFNWLAAVLNISERDAIVRFNDFVFDLKKRIASGATVKWIGVGTLTNGLAGAVKFSPDSDIIIEQPVVAEKIIRENYKHTVRVGEDERTSTEMVEMLSQPKKKQSLWWAYALVLALISFIFVCWYFSEHGLNVSSTANGKKLNPTETTATYRTLP